MHNNLDTYLRLKVAFLHEKYPYVVKTPSIISFEKKNQETNKIRNLSKSPGKGSC